MTYKGYLIDLDGTMYTGDRPIDGASDFIDRLIQAGKKFIFLTNNSTAAPEKVAGKLQAMGIKARPEQVYTSSLATADLLEDRGYQTAFVVGEAGLKEAIQGKGIQLLAEGAEVLVVGLNRHSDYAELSQAYRNLQDGADFIVTNADRRLPQGDHHLPSAGALMAFLEYCSGQKATVVGKPQPIIMEKAIDYIGLAKEDIALVGDNFETDILGGIRAGLDTIAVETGVSTRDDYLATAEQPSHIIKNLREWIIE